MKKIRALILAFFLLLSASTWAAEMHCGVCNMTIPEHSREHVVLKKGSGDSAPLHVCSLACALKGKKYDKSYVKFEVTDFNHPDKTLSGDQAFFLIGSRKIKADLGDMAMPPFFAAFKTRKEAEDAQKKYGEGEVVQGFQNVH